MTIQITSGDLLQQEDVDAIVNTVNCVGVMGKGIALQFRHKWPQNYAEYRAECAAGRVRPGTMFVHNSGGLVKPNYIINFPTKDHWRGASELEYISEGLVDLIAQVKRLNIRSLAIPPLGCGNGGLDWADVRPLIEDAFAALPDVEVRLFEPNGAPNPKSMVVRGKRPGMTAGRAAILRVLDTYKELSYGLSRIEVQKLAYFLQEAGEPLNLDFVKHHYGPYADKLRHALTHMEGHFIRGLGDGVVESEIEPLGEALEEAKQFIVDHGNAELFDRVEKVRSLISGFQSSYGMELLATVHWVSTREGAAQNLNDVVTAIRDWNARKRDLMTRQHIEVAWTRLCEEGWLEQFNSLQSTSLLQAEVH